MTITKRRIRFKLKSGQWTYWLNDDEVRRYRNDHIECAVIEETMSYEDAMKYLRIAAEDTD